MIILKSYLYLLNFFYTRYNKSHGNSPSAIRAIAIFSFLLTNYICFLLDYILFKIVKSTSKIIFLPNSWYYFLVLATVLCIHVFYYKNGRYEEIESYFQDRSINFPLFVNYVFLLLFFFIGLFLMIYRIY